MKISQEINSIDVTLLITFHNEGILAHSTLNSIERCREFASSAGICTEYVLVFDSVDAETRKVVIAHPVTKLKNSRIIEVHHRDLGASRNSGIKVSKGKAIAILDGDDYFSTNWIERAWFFLQDFGAHSILHPEFVINFGAHSAYCWQIDQQGKYYDRAGLLVGNCWTSWTFAMRSIYEQCPYTTTRTIESGFGYEDWHWNCETIALGFEHRLAWGTIGFYRRKIRSLVELTTEMGAIIPQSKLFSKQLSSELLK